MTRLSTSSDSRESDDTLLLAHPDSNARSPSTAGEVRNAGLCYGPTLMWPTVCVNDCRNPVYNPELACSSRILWPRSSVQIRAKTNIQLSAIASVHA